MIGKIITVMLFFSLLFYTISFAKYYVKVFKTEDKETASAVLYNLLTNNFENCKLEKAGKYFLILCGPFGDLTKAKKFSSKINKLGYFSVVIKDSKKLTEKKYKPSRRKKSKRNLKRAFLGMKVKEMYKLLNKGNLEGAETLAYSLLNTSFKDEAVFVLGIVNMQRGNNRKACKLFSLISETVKPDAKDLKEIACLYKEANEGKRRVKTEQRKDLKTTSLKREKLLKASKLLAKGKYEEALTLAKGVLKESPTNIEAILLIADIYTKKKKYPEAYSYYKMAYSLDKRNLRAIKGLMYTSLALKKLSEAYKYAKTLENLGFNSEEINKVKALYFAKKAEDLIKKDKLDEAYIYLKKAKELYEDEPYIYILFGDVHFKRKNFAEAYKYYSKAYIKFRNFGALIKLLYVLVELENFDLINDFLRDIHLKELKPSQLKDLKDFYRYLYIKASSYYLKNKNYKKAFTIVKEGLIMFPEEKTLIMNLSWACLNMENFKCAEKNFKKLLQENKKDYDAAYGLSLVYAKLGKEEAVEKYIKILEKKKDPDTYMKIADIYTILGNYEKAKYFLKRAENLQHKTELIDLQNTNTLEKLNRYEKLEGEEKNFYNPFIFKKNNNLKQYKINKNLTKDENNNDDYFNKMRRKLLEKVEIGLKKQNTDFLSVDFQVNVKSGRTGLDKLTIFTVNLIGEKKLNNNLFLWTKNKILYLDSGGKPDYRLVGSSHLPVIRDINTSFSGFEPFIGLKFGRKNYISGGVGLTPIGNSPISPTITFSLELGMKKRSYSFEFSLKKDSVRDTLLSYTGLKDPHSSKSWGRVTEQGGEIKFQLGSGYKTSFISFKTGYYSLKGKNTSSNWRFFGEIYPSIYLGKTIMDEDYIGIFFRYENFDKNENVYYFGYGGYFSPPNFILLGPKYTGYLPRDMLILRFNMLVGFLSFDEQGKRTNTLGIDVSTDFEYKFREKISLLGAVGYRNSKNYDEIVFILGLKYYFRGLINPFRKTVDKLDGRLLP